MSDAAEMLRNAKESIKDEVADEADWTFDCPAAAPEPVMEWLSLFGTWSARERPGQAWIRSLGKNQLCATTVFGRAVESVNIPFLIATTLREEDLAGFVQDYIGKDISLKGAFLIEDPGSGKVLKLSLESAPRRSEAGPAGSRVMEAVFKAAGGRKYSVLFYLQSAGFGGIDIFRIELKKEAAAGKK